MFEEQIAQGRDMVRRLEAESRLPSGDREALPSWKRVPMKEAQEWHRVIEAKLKAHYGPETFDRYQLARNLFSEALDRGEGDEYSRALDFWERILALLTELSAREVPAAQSRTTEQPHPAEQNRLEDSAGPTYDVFISHAWEDKDTIARPLYTALVERGATVWFDEATLMLGDSLRRSIDRGLARCRFGVVVLSPDFLAKEWPQRELDGLVARETVSGEKAILPLWHRLDAKSVAQYSPTLADRLAVRSDQGLSAIVEQILRVVQATHRT
ncbi:toll/interleukin-1 receptor domain-containing protein [Longimicrobium sp.]|jgi:hypothetical protein|uniref:toll/interleukin-1 receptor domain-containing protein n=1 Tax=Longimicrobium sp. TaxID=2029185 RepID=UPI002F949F11